MGRVRRRGGQGGRRDAGDGLSDVTSCPESDRLLALHRASAALAAQTGVPDAALDEILRSAVTLLGAGSASLYRWDDEAKLLRCVRNWNVPAADTTPDVLPGEGLAGLTFLEGRPLIVNDYPAWKSAMPSGRAGGLRAGLGVPLRHAGRAIGVLLIRSYRDDTPPFTEGDGRLVTLFGDQAAAALENVELHRRLEGRLERLRTLTRLNQIVSSTLDMDEVLREIARAAATLMDVPFIAFGVVASEQTIELRAFSDDTIGAAFSTRTLPIVGSAMGLVATERRPVSIDDAIAEDGLFDQGWRRAFGLPSLHAVPVVFDGTLYAVLGLNGPKPFRFSADDEDLLESFVAQAAVAIRNASLYEARNGSNAALEEEVLRSIELAATARAAERAARQSEERFRHQALHDPLTELANRTLFRDRVELAVERAVRDETRVAVLFLDLDDFKTVNDSLGHEIGDRVLIDVAERLESCVRVGDTAARLGGDEFAILLEDAADGFDPAGLAERVLDNLGAPFRVLGKDLFIRASVGIVVSGGEGADELLRNADVAMYQAKARGKGRAETFEPGMHTAVMARLELEADLRAAVEQQQLVVHYQPILSLDSGRVSAVEALVRWDHPTRGLLPPGEFIPLAEGTGLIVEIGRQVLERACRQASAWQAARPSEPPLQITVNLSVRQLHDPGLVDDVARALEGAGLEARNLTLEITESVMLQDTESIVAVLHALKGLGVRLAVDDFGTGYSSLRYLQRLPIDILKIDRSFVEGLGSGQGGVSLVQAIVQLGDSLGLAAVAEGIERAEQLDELCKLGCEYGQGFYFAKPLPGADLSLLLAGVPTAGSSTLQPGRSPGFAA